MSFVSRTALSLSSAPTRAASGAPRRGGLPVRRPRLSSCRAAQEDATTTVLGGEWAANWSLTSYDDVLEFYSHKILKETPSALLVDIMSKSVITATPETPIDHVRSHFEKVSGLPVVREDGVLVGIVSKKDLAKPGALVHEVMSTPPIAALGSTRVSKAAALMLKHKVHRIPVVDKNKKVIGIVTRTDVFTSLDPLDTTDKERRDM